MILLHDLLSHPFLSIILLTAAYAGMSIHCSCHHPTSHTAHHFSKVSHLLLFLHYPVHVNDDIVNQKICFKTGMIHRDSKALSEHGCDDSFKLAASVMTFTDQASQAK